ncbi:MAG: FkbM family methyltransferase [Lachnospiraceae bacterium]|nr:FkbM family methyltransferase [Lachnospiraceae bacterium]
MFQDIKEIYSHFADGLSGQIYLERLNYSISGDDRYINRLLDLTVRNSDSWREFCNTMTAMAGEEVVLFGAGIWGDTFLKEFKDFRWKCILDNVPKQAEKAGIPIVNASEFLKDYRNEKIVISSYKNRDSMITQCVEANVPRENIIDGGNVIYSLTEGKIYFDSDIALNISDGLFVDGGCFDGSDSKRWIERFHSKALCFEPDVNNIEKIKSRLAGYENDYRIVPKALWSSETELSFSSNGSQGSRIDASGTENTVSAASIDIEAGDEPVCMIKMDIEGAELEALHGAEKIIRRDHPVLAISIYHKPEDIFTLPEYILSVHKGYRLYLRHYSFSWYDTVLYAVPEVM